MTHKQQETPLPQGTIGDIARNRVLKIIIINNNKNNSNKKKQQKKKLDTKAVLFKQWSTETRGRKNIIDNRAND